MRTVTFVQLMLIFGFSMLIMPSCIGAGAIETSDMNTGGTLATDAYYETLCIGSINVWEAIAECRIEGELIDVTVFETSLGEQCNPGNPQPPGFVGVSWSEDGPFTSSITKKTECINGFAISVFFVKGLAIGSTGVDVYSPQNGCYRPGFCYYDVSSITDMWIEPLDSLLSPTSGAGGGLKIYPDRNDPSDSLNRKKFKLVATTSVPGSYIFFNRFDVDDPTSDMPPIDPNGAAGGDNRDLPNDVGYLKVMSDTSGRAETDYEVSMQPGDNFRFAATCSWQAMCGIEVYGTALIKDGEILDEDHWTENIRVSPLITVWRRLHIEVDSMGPVTGNQMKGSIQSIRFNSNAASSVIRVDSYLESNRFQNGLLTIEGDPYPYHVIDNGRDTIKVVSEVPQSDVGKSFTLVDDDNYRSTVELKGDEGVDVFELPDTFTLLQESEDPSANVFAPAFIMPILDGGGDFNNNNGFLDFVLNVGTGNENLETTQINKGITSAWDEREDYWIAYLQLAYQPSSREDNDPDNENQLLGVTPVQGKFVNAVSGSEDVPVGGQGSLLFLETIHDTFEEGRGDWEQRIAPHEIGHQFGLGGDDRRNQYGIMSYYGPLSFVPDHINVLRYRVKSPGT